MLRQKQLYSPGSACEERRCLGRCMEYQREALGLPGLGCYEYESVSHTFSLLNVYRVPPALLDMPSNYSVLFMPYIYKSKADMSCRCVPPRRLLAAFAAHPSIHR